MATYPNSPRSSSTYQNPSHVTAIGFLALLAVLGGIAWMILGDMIIGVAICIQSVLLLALQAVAEDAAYGRWRVDRLSGELQIVINEMAAQANAREQAIRQRERELREAQLEQRRLIQAEK